MFTCQIRELDTKLAESDRRVEKLTHERDQLINELNEANSNAEFLANQNQELELEVSVVVVIIIIVVVVIVVVVVVVIIVVVVVIIVRLRGKKMSLLTQENLLIIYKKNLNFNL